MFQSELNDKTDNLALMGSAIITQLTKKSTRTLLYIDLHGKSVLQAKEAVFKHVRKACADGWYNCRIITGRGNHINAKGNRGVIFDACEIWLESDELKPLIEHYERKDGYYTAKLKTPDYQFDAEEDAAFCQQYFIAIKEKAERKEDPNAQFELACFYSSGFGSVNINHKAAFKWFLAAANQGHVDALGQIGHLYLIGEGVRQNDKLAIEWLTKAANKKHAGSAYTLSSIYLNGWGTNIDANLGIAWAAKSANWGNIMAMRRVGNFFYQGIIAKKDPEKTYQWYLRAANLGDAYSQYQIGLFHQIGHGTCIDIKKSFTWISLAAEGGDIDAMMLIGDYYLSGNGCKKNVKKGLEWLNKADAFGSTHANFFIGQYYLECKKIDKARSSFINGTKAGSILAQESLLQLNFEEDDKREQLLELLAAQPIDDILEKLLPFTKLILGTFMLNNPAKSKKATTQRQQKGVVILKSTAKTGQSEAYKELGFYFGKTNLQKAFEYWQKGAEASDVDSMFMCALYLELYQKNSQNDSEIYSLLKKAAAANHPAALFLLGIKVFLEQPLITQEFQDPSYYLTSAIKQTSNAISSVGPHMACYKAFHAIGVILSYTTHAFPPESHADYMQNILTANEYFRKAAEMNYNKAQFDLGIGLVANYDTFQEGIHWLEQAAKQNDQSAQKILTLYQQYTNLPVEGLIEFNQQISPVVKRTSQKEKIGFSKNDFHKMIANYFDSSQKVQAEISQEKEEKMAISKKETILTAEETSIKEESLLIDTDEKQPPKIESELLVKHSSVFHSPGEDISLVTNQNEENPQKKVTSQKPNASLEDKEKPAQSPIESVSIRNNSCDPQEQSQSKESETIDTSYEDSIEKNKAIQSTEEIQENVTWCSIQ